MDASFWHQKWEKNEIAFHEPDANPMLVKYFSKLSLAEGSRIFLPLCGKTLDIAWLMTNGYRAVGVELSETAIGQLFTGLGIKPKMQIKGEVRHYSAENIDIFAGNVFHVSKEMIGSVDAVYDRAALVALPEQMRVQYAAHVMSMTNQSSQLLITYEYDQTLQEGPPFSVTNEEVKRHYKNHYQLTHLESIDIPGGLKGKCLAKENVWLLKTDSVNSFMKNTHE